MHDEGANAGLVTEAESAEDSSRFHDTFMVLYDSYKRKRGRTLDPEQVQVLVDAFHEISSDHAAAIKAVEGADQIIEQLQAQIEELERKEKEIWRPKWAK